MRRISTSIIGLFFLTVALSAQAPVKPEDQIMALETELREAAKSRDRSVFERIIADNFFFIHSNGVTESRKMYIDNFVSGLQTVQQEGVGGTLIDERVVMNGPDAAVYVRRGTLTNPARNLNLRLRSVSVFSKVNGRWQKIFGQSSPLPPRPDAAKIDLKLLDAYVGEYQVRDGVIFAVRREGDSLLTTQTFRQPGELIPQSDIDFIWYNPDMVYDGKGKFIKDAAGFVTHAAFIANGNEIWRAKKVK